MRVAVLEDNPARAILLEQTLRLGGHEAVRFREGGALMQALRNEPYALLLMAWEIPGIPARDVLLWIRRTLGNELPVMLLSQHDDDDISPGASPMARMPSCRPRCAAPSWRRASMRCCGAWRRWRRPAVT
ncbi:hypothetical protein [Cupriavidus sp. D39]|uniref:hypothetical protein n=1 Tax=Cupriavidus sp. D39 TaxID=2997877 RepID=UPI002D1E3F48|nr:hypothetical protein [Cupriavidus sp. D39]